MLKFLLDVGVGNSVKNMLDSSGFDVISMTDIDPSATDLAILALAELEKRMVITMDKDFGELIFT